jgi:protein gp37
MGQQTGIAWCHHTFNPWIGCTKVDALCRHCYAEDLAERRGWARWGPLVPRHVTSAATWQSPLAWHRAALRAGVRRRVFCASLADVFEDRRDLDAPRTWLWALIAATPALDWLLLTKRPEHMPRLVPVTWRDGWPANVWAGTSVGDAASVGRIAELRAVPTVVRFLSCEPLLETLPALDLTGVAWVIGGGESGPGCRPPSLAAVRGLRDQCVAAHAAFFFKQWGGRTPKAGGKLLDGREWCEVP